MYLFDCVLYLLLFNAIDQINPMANTNNNIQYNIYLDE